MSDDGLAAAVAEAMPAARAALERLVRIPSVAFPSFPREPVLKCAGAVADELRAAGVEEVELLDIGDAPPAVYGRVPGQPDDVHGPPSASPDGERGPSGTGAPSVLLYAHYDVQPAGPEEDWTTPPFEPTEHDGRLRGRGAADDKSGIAMHLAALRAWRATHGDGSPVEIRVVIEGEEETGRGIFEAYLERHPEPFVADAIVVGDSGNMTLGEPALTTSLRGLAAVSVEVSSLRAPVHSGLGGGAAPDALLALIRMLSTLIDERGNVTVDGLAGGEWDGAAVDEAGFRREVGVLDGVELVGDGSLGTRLFEQPSISVIGLDAPPTAGAANALVATARATVSARLAPGEDPDEASAAIRRHLEAAAPWGVRVRTEPLGQAEGFAAPTDGPVYRAAKAALFEAYGREAVLLGTGGAIPLITALHKAIPQAEIVIWGPEDAGARIHSSDEGVDLAELERSAVAEALFLREMTRGARMTPPFS